MKFKHRPVEKIRVLIIYKGKLYDQLVLNTNKLLAILLLYLMFDFKYSFLSNSPTAFEMLSEYFVHRQIKIVFRFVQNLKKIFLHLLI